MQDVVVLVPLPDKQLKLFQSGRLLALLALQKHSNRIYY